MYMSLMTAYKDTGWLAATVDIGRMERKPVIFNDCIDINSVIMSGIKFSGNIMLKHDTIQELKCLYSTHV